MFFVTLAASCSIVALISAITGEKIQWSIFPGLFIFITVGSVIFYDLYHTPCHYRVVSQKKGFHLRYALEMQNIFGKWIYIRGYTKSEDIAAATMLNYRYWDTNVNWFGDKEPSTLTKTKENK